MISDACGTTVVAIEKAQYISTPEYPHQYRSNLTCTWKITSNTNYLVRIETGYVTNDTCCEHLEVSVLGQPYGLYNLLHYTTRYGFIDTVDT